MIVRPAQRIHGQLTMPGDKSIAHRAAMIASLAEGTSRISNYSNSADCAATLSCLEQFGVGIERRDSQIIVKRAGSLRTPAGALDCENSGTTMRLLAGILAGQQFTAVLTGDGSLRARPMQRVIEPLQMMGARISSLEGRAPLTIAGTKSLTGITYELLIASAQVKSAILLAGLSANGRTEVIEDVPTRDHTERMLQAFGVAVETGVAEREGANSHFARLDGPARLQAHDVSVPGDISSAAYFVAAAALVEGSSIRIDDVGLNPTRTEVLNQLRRTGFDIAISDETNESNEPRGRITVKGRQQGMKQADRWVLDGLLIPKLIDELPLLAVVGSQLHGGVEIRNAKELRVKESNRIAVTAQNLRAMGADVEEFDDGLRVQGPTRLRGGKINPHGDHRIAMSFAIAALVADGETEIEDAACVSVSCPGFFDMLQSVIE